MSEHETDYKRFEGERIISVSDLFEEILRKIWLVIIFAIAFAVILAGYKYASDKSRAFESNEAVALEKVDHLSDEEMREIESIQMLYDEVEARQKYLNESIKMNIDPYHEDRILMQFALEVEDENLINVLQMLDNYTSGAPLADDLQEFYPDEDITYLAELVTFDSENLSLDISDLENPIYQSNIFTVKVMHNDADACKQLANVVQQCLENYLEDISVYFGTCKIILLDERASLVYDSSLKNTQTSELSDQITLLNRITTQTGYLSEEQLDVLNASLEGTEGSETTSSDREVVQNTANVHISRRYTLLGLLIGIVLAIIIIALYYIFRKTLNILQELQNGFGISIFGQLHTTKQKNPLVKAWRSLTGKQKKLSLETEQKIALTNLRNFCKSHQVDRILLAGSQKDLPENSWVIKIQTALEAEQIKMEIVGELPDSPESLEELNAYSYVVLVETLHQSLFTDVVSEIEICKAQEIQIAGAIVFD